MLRRNRGTRSCLLGLILSPFILLSCASEDSRVPTTRAELIALLGPNYRPTQGRLVGFGYAPCTAEEPEPGEEDLVPDVRCSSLDELPDEARGLIRRAHARIHPIEETAYRGIGNHLHQVEDLHLAGLVELLKLGERDLELAVANLERAAMTDHGSAEIHSDLSVAYLERAEDLDQPQALARAFTESSLALELEPDLPEALFNRALALERLLLDGAASDAWERYSKAEPVRPRAEEALARSRELAQASGTSLWIDDKVLLLSALQSGNGEVATRLVAKHPKAVFTVLLDEILPESLDSSPALLTVSAAARFQLLVSILEETIGEYSLSGLTVTSATQEVQISPRYFRPLQALLEARNSRSVTSIETAKQLLRRELPQLSPWADELLGVRLYIQERYEESLSLFSRLLEEDCTAASPLLCARAHWMAGLNQLVLGNYSPSLRHYEEALKAYRELDDRASAAQMHRLLAEEYFLIGELRLAWHHVHRAFGNRPYVYSQESEVGLLAVLARSISQSHPHLAFLLHSEMLQLAEIAAIPRGLVDAYTYRAFDLLRMGKHDAAISDLQSAGSLLPEVEDVAVRRRQATDLLLIDGLARGQAQDWSEAIDSLSHAIDHYSEANHHFYATTALLARANLFLKSGRLDRADADLEAGLQESRSQTSSIRSEWLRTLLQDNLRRFCDEKLILLYEQAAPPTKLLETTERCRAQSLISSLLRSKDVGQSRYRDPATIQASAKNLQEALPSGTAALSFWTTSDFSLRLLITEADIEVKELEATADEVRHLASLVSHRLERGDPPEMLDPLFRGLGEALLPPGPTLSTISDLKIIPDDVLQLIPFAGLIPPASDAPLAETLAVSFLPSLSLLHHGAQLATRSVDVEKVLILAPSGSLGYPPLPETLREAKEIAELYAEGQVDLLLGPEATPEAFLRGLATYEVVHFAGHADISANESTSARLWLAGADTAAPEALWVRDLPSASRSSAGLLILSACSTASGRVSPSEGLLSFSRSLLASGVRNVVATQRRVQDLPQRALMLDLHKSLVDGLEPAKALQLAQLRSLQRGPAIKDWASVIHIQSF